MHRYPASYLLSASIAARVSRDTGEIVHVVCRDVAQAETYGAHLEEILGDDVESSGTLACGAEREYFTDTVRVHLSVQQDTP